MDAAMNERQPGGSAAPPKVLSGLHYFSVGFGTIVGVAWIVVMGPLVAQANAGGAAVALLIGGLMIAVIGACYAQLAERFPEAGGEFVYARDLGGRRLAFAVGWTLVLVYTSVAAYVAIAVGALSLELFPQLRGTPIYISLGMPIYPIAIVIGLTANILLVALHVLGARGSAQMQTFVSLMRILLIVAFLVVAIHFARPSNLSPLIAGRTASEKLSAIFVILGTAPFWYAGFNTVVTAAEEAATSTKTLGRALIAAIMVAALFYVLLVLAIGGLVPVTALRHMQYPAAEAFTSALGDPTMAKVVLAVGFLGNLTAWNGILFAGSRTLFALGRAQLAPARLARLNAFGVPSAALFTMGIASALAVFGGPALIMPLVNIVSTSFAFTYLVSCLALLSKLRRETHLSVRASGPRSALAVAGIASSLIIFGISLVQPVFQSPGFPLEYVTIAIWIAVILSIWKITQATRRDNAKT